MIIIILMVLMKFKILLLKYFVADRAMPVLVKSLRSQRVRHVTAGEYHTAVLTEVQSVILKCIFF